MTDQLKKMIDKLKEQEIKKEPKKELGKSDFDDSEDEEPEKAGEELSKEQKITLSQRIQELQNNGIYRLELLIELGELKEAIKDLSLIIGSLIKK